MNWSKPAECWEWAGERALGGMDSLARLSGLESSANMKSSCCSGRGAEEERRSQSGVKEPGERSRGQVLKNVVSLAEHLCFLIRVHGRSLSRGGMDTELHCVGHSGYCNNGKTGSRHP